MDVAAAELDVGPSGGPDSSPRRFEDVGVHVDADHRALWTDQLGQRQCDVACSAAQIKHLHPRGDASRHEELAGQLPKQLVLDDQSFGLGFAATEGVAVGFNRRSTRHARHI